jgi:predicted secreted protein
MKSPHNFPKIMIVNADSKMMSAISIETDSEFERDKDNRMKFSLTLDF